VCVGTVLVVVAVCSVTWCILYCIMWGLVIQTREIHTCMVTRVYVHTCMSHTIHTHTHYTHAHAYTTGQGGGVGSGNQDTPGGGDGNGELRWTRAPLCQLPYYHCLTYDGAGTRATEKERGREKKKRKCVCFLSVLVCWVEDLVTFGATYSAGMPRRDYESGCVCVFA